MAYAIAFTDPDIDPRPCYWTTRYGDTDNYTLDPKDATLFVHKSAAYALMKTLGLDDDHEVVIL